MRKLWHDEAWEEYLYWQSQIIDGNDLEILQCGTHYKDK